MKETRNTSQREIVRNEILLHKGHLTADQIYGFINGKYPTISRATVFRNLKLLVERGEIGHVPTIDGADCFDYRKHQHYHFKCQRCQGVFDTDVPYDDALDQLKTKFQIKHHVTLFYGICDACQKK